MWLLFFILVVSSVPWVLVIGSVGCVLSLWLVVAQLILWVRSLIPSWSCSVVLVVLVTEVDTTSRMSSATFFNCSSMPSLCLFTSGVSLSSMSVLLGALCFSSDDDDDDDSEEVSPSTTGGGA